MKKAFFPLFLLLFLSSCSKSLSPADYITIQNDVKGFLKNIQIVDVQKSEIDGVYEIYYNGTYPNIIYYYPQQNLLIFGEIWTVNGESITASKRENFLKRLQQTTTGGKSGGE